METLAALREQGKIRHVALSNVTQEHIERAAKSSPSSLCKTATASPTANGITWSGIASRTVSPSCPGLRWAKTEKRWTCLEKVARELGATTLQTALAWLLKRSKIILPIPGTSSPAHVEENIAAAGFELPEAAFKELSNVTPPPVSYRVSSISSS